MRRATRAFAALAVATAALSACATPLPSPTPPPPAAVAPPALLPTQSQAVLADLGTVLASADKALDASKLAPRVIGPALAMRSAEYLRAEATNGDRAPTALPTKPQVQIVPQTTTWPRVQVVVTVQPDDLQAPRVLVLEQATPRDRYALWGWARMFPNASTPSMADAAKGSPVLPVDDSALAMAPDKVLAAYADVLANGDGSASAAQFAPDQFRDQVAQTRQTLAANVQDIGQVAETYTPNGPPLTVIGDAAGGALVVGSMSTVSTVGITLAGAKLTLSPFESAAAGASEAGKSLARTYTDVLVFHVPAAGSGKPVQLIAAESVLTAVAAQ
jgi:hypothetical protein